jgi:hypothetical protein
MPLCEACQAESDAWLDTKPSEVLPSFGIAHGSGAAYDSTAAGIRDNNSARWKAWRELVVEQRRLIRAGCTAGIHSANRQEPKPLHTIYPGEYL